MTGTLTLDRDHVRKATRASRSNFYYSFLFLPRPRREALESVYAFCRAVDDAVDEAEDPARAEELIGHWRGELAAATRGEGTNPITRALAVCLKRYPVDPRHLGEVIDGVAMDLTVRRYAAFEDLERYCYHVAGAVGLVCIEIFGYRDPAARDYAVALGLAFQMTNILRDVGRDAEAGRVYLPAGDLARFGCTEADLAAATPSPALREMMRFQTARARDLFRKAKDLFPVKDRRTLYAAEIMGAIYESLLDAIERRGHDVLGDTVRLSRPRKLAIAAGCFLRSRFA